MTNTEAAYIAGLIDGEGSITLCRQKSTETHSLVVSIANNDRILLEWVRATLGGGSIVWKRARSSRHKESYEFRLKFRPALDLLETVLPYLRTYKKQRAELILQELPRLTKKNGKYSEQEYATRLKWVERVLAIQAA